VSKVKSDTESFSRADIAAMKAQGEVLATPENAPLYDPDEAFWASAELVPTHQPRKVSVHLRLDPEVLAFFKAGGDGHLTRMAQVLKSYAKAKSRPSE
jgi:uncharacterized protein (DUF4415 family)